MLARSRRSVVVIDAGRAAQRAGRGGARAAGPRRHAARRAAGAGPGRGPAATAAGWWTGEVAAAVARRRRVRGHAGRRPVGAGAAVAGDHRPGRRAARRAGLRERWGRDVLHCPYCHGWEVRDQAVGVLASGPMSVHQALLFRQLTADVTFFSHTLPPDRRAGRAARRSRHHGRRRRGGRASRSPTTGSTGVRLATARRRPPRRAWSSRPGWSRGPASWPVSGCGPVEHPSGVGEHVPADPTGQTEVPGVWVAGQRHRPDRAGRRGRGGRGDGSGPHQRRPRHGGDAGGGRRVPGALRAACPASRRCSRR